MLRPSRTHKPAAQPAPLWMSVDEAAPLLGVSRDTIYRAIKSGTLEHIQARRIGRRVVLSHADVMAPARPTA